MRVEELEHSTIYEVLKKSKDAQRAVLKLGTLEEWVILRQFVAELKQTLLEAALEVDSLDEIKRLKNLIYGFESIVLLPGLVELVKETAKTEALKKEKEKKDAKRRKYNPGVFVKRMIEKVRG